MLPHLIEHLEQCQCSLVQYLELKRMTFPRFFFVSDHVLLEFLTNKTRLVAEDMEMQLRSIFEGIAGLCLESDDTVSRDDQDWADASEDAPTVTKVISKRSGMTEEIQLITGVGTGSEVENWLKLVDEQTQATLRALTRETILSGNDHKIEDLIANCPAQISILFLHGKWTQASVSALRLTNSEPGILTSTTHVMNNLKAELVMLLGRASTPVQKFSLQNMILVQMHLCDLFQNLVTHNIDSVNAFEYLKTPRLQMDEQTQSLVVLGAGAHVRYGYDYEGLSERMVVTPTTDRCTIGFLNSLTVSMCCAFVGPANHGKSSVVKEIGKLIGRFVAVVNCQEHLDRNYLEKFFRGLPSAGCLGCFEEFNRLSAPVMSACAQQLGQILMNIRKTRNSSAFESALKLQNLTSSADLRLGLVLTFSTKSVADSEEMKHLQYIRGMCRTCAITAVDAEYLARVKLAAAGFKDHTTLATKLSLLVQNVSVVLGHSARVRSLGVRTLLTVIEVASRSRLERMASNESAMEDSDDALNESQILMHAARSVFTPRLSNPDVRVFSSVLEDVFGFIVSTEASSHGKWQLMESITLLMRKFKMDKQNTWMEKILQLQDLTHQNHGVMVLGGATSGKSAMIAILQRALQSSAPQDTVPETYTLEKLNPKSLTVLQMYGWWSSEPEQWVDGAFSHLCRWRRPPGISTWIVLDGPIDPLWAENLNTVLDQHKVLTLANGDRIPMKATTRFIFESDTCDNASPATMARVGMLWVPVTALPWRSYVNKWIEGRGSEERMILRSLFDRYMDHLLHFVKMQCSPVIQTPVNFIPCMLTSLFDCTAKYLEFRWDGNGEEFLEKVFIFCLAWAFGGLLENIDRMKLSQFMYTLTDLLPVMKNDTTLFDFYPNDNMLDWDLWSSHIPEWKHPEPFDPSNLYVCTLDTCRTDFLLRLLLSQKLNVLVTGATASCKSHSLRHFVTSLDADKWFSRTIAFSQTTESRVLVDSIHGAIHKRQGRTFGPEPGKSCVIVVDDINLSAVDGYGDQRNCELVRQLISDGGYYDLKTPSEWAAILGLNYICVMTHPFSTNRDVPMRLKGQLCAINITVPFDKNISTAMTKIFSEFFSIAQTAEMVLKMAQMLPEATIALCKSLKQTLASSDTKIHYSFDLHDIMRVLRSLLHCNPSEFGTPEQVMRMWRHECERVFSDKLVNSDHRQVVSERIEHILQHKSFDGINREECLAKNNDRFGAFFREDEEGFGVLPDMGIIYERIEQLQSIEKVTYGLYDEAVNLVVRVARVLCTSRGCVVLVGSLSSGRSTLSRLAIFVAGSQCLFSKEDVLQGRVDVRKNIADAYFLAGLEARSVTVVLTSRDLMDHVLVDTVNNFLLTGEMSGFIEAKEIDAFAEQFRRETNDSNLPTDRQAQTMFEQRAWQNLHLVLCCDEPSALDKTKISIEELMKCFPGLHKACQTIWMLPWSSETLKDVATNHFSLDFADPSLRRDLTKYVADVHMSVQTKIHEYIAGTPRHIYVTPRTFLDFLSTYKSIFVSQSQVVEDRIQRTQTALKKLGDAGYQVSEMKNELIDREQALQESEEDTAEQLKEISMRTMVAEKKKAVFQLAHSKLEQRSRDLQLRREALLRGLESNKPLLLEAQSALDSVSKEDFLALGTQKSQPALVKLVLDSVLLVIRHSVRPVEMQTRDSFSFFVEMVSADEDGFSDGYERLQAVLRGLPRRRVNEEDEDDLTEESYGGYVVGLNGETAELLSPLLASNEFSLPNISAVSEVAAALGLWMQAMVRYHEATARILQDLDLVGQQEADLRCEYDVLAVVQEEFDEAQRDLDSLHSEFEKTVAHKQEQTAAADRARKKLAASTSLLMGLQEERARWIQDTEENEAHADPLPGDAGIASAMMVYLGPFSREERGELLQMLSSLCNNQEINFSPELHVPKFFTSQNEIGSWFVQGLPSDEFSIQNGMLALYCSRFPLLIDPQEQCATWIKERETPRVLNQFAQKLELEVAMANAIVNGRFLIFECIEGLVDANIDGILDQIFIHRKSSDAADIAPASAGLQKWESRRLFWMGKELEWHPDFRIILLSRLTDPHFDPALCGRTTIIDCSVTARGLEDQLMKVVIEHDNMELLEARLTLLTEVNNLRAEMDDLDKSILNELSESEGNLLDNDELMHTLSDMKKMLTGVDERLLQAEEAESDVLKAYEDYRPIAHRGSLIYFSLLDMAKIDRMYRISADHFESAFQMSLSGGFSKSRTGTDTPASPVTGRQERILNTLDRVTTGLLRTFVTGLSREHRRVFELSVALRLDLPEQEHKNPDYIHCLSTCGAVLEISLIKRKSAPWLSDSAWLNMVYLTDRHPALRSLLDSMSKNSKSWQAWYEHSAPESEKVPDHDNLEPLHSLMLVRALREDRMLAATRRYFLSVVGDYVSGQDEFDLQPVCEMTSPRQPIILLAPNGDDPVAAILSHARWIRQECNVLPMGEDYLKSSVKAPAEVVHGSRVQSELVCGASSGAWVVLQNVHLCSSTDLERILTASSSIFDSLESCLQIDMNKHQSPTAKQVSAAHLHHSSLHVAQDGDGGPGTKRASRTADHAGRQASSFRLWLTAPSWGTCPMTLILRSVRVFYEAPVTVRSTMLHLYSQKVVSENIDRKINSDTDAVVISSNNDASSRAWARQVFCLTLFYSIVVSWRRYGSSGWSRPFELDITDWTSSAQYLKSFVFDPVQESLSGSQKVKDELIRTSCWMLSNVLLGGKLQEEADARRLQLLLERTMTDGIFSTEPNAPIHDCKMPEGTGHASFLEAITDMPKSDTATLLGLRNNADALYRLDMSRRLIGTLPKLMSFVPSPSSQIEMEQVVTEISTNMLARIPSPWKSEERMSEAQNGMIAQHAFLQQEMERMQLVLQTVRSSLQTLLLSISGTTPMSEIMREMMQSLFDAVVPTAWIACSWNISSLGEWIGILMQRQDQLSRCLHHRLKTIWIPGLFNPAGLFVALKQDAVRRNRDQRGWQMHQLALAIQIGDPQKTKSKTKAKDDDDEKKKTTKKHDEDHEDSVVVTGVSVDGCIWSAKEGTFIDCPKRSLLRYAEMPKLAVTVYREEQSADELQEGQDKDQSQSQSPVADTTDKKPRKKGNKQRAGLGKVASQDVFRCPMYSSPRRTSAAHILDVPVMTENEQQALRFVLRGVALLACTY